jgi:hypothetical protein
VWVHSWHRLLLYEDYVWVSLGNAMKAKQSKAMGNNRSAQRTALSSTATYVRPDAHVAQYGKVRMGVGAALFKLITTGSAKQGHVSAKHMHTPTGRPWRCALTTKSPRWIFCSACLMSGVVGGQFESRIGPPGRVGLTSWQAETAPPPSGSPGPMATWVPPHPQQHQAQVEGGAARPGYPWGRTGPCSACSDGSSGCRPALSRGQHWQPPGGSGTSVGTNRGTAATAHGQFKFNLKFLLPASGPVELHVPRGRSP